MSWLISYEPRRAPGTRDIGWNYTEQALPLRPREDFARA
jgi:hypothetical protein